MLPCGVRTFLPLSPCGFNERSLRPTRREDSGNRRKGKLAFELKMIATLMRMRVFNGLNPRNPMKTFTTLLITVTAGILTTHAEDAPKKTAAAGGKIQEMMLQKFDANKNGTLEPDERAAAMKTFQERKSGSAKGGEKVRAFLMQKFDANKNGVLDPEEREAAMKAAQERRGKSGGIPGAGGKSTENGGNFRRPPEAPKEGDTAKK